MATKQKYDLLLMSGNEFNQESPTIGTLSNDMCNAQKQEWCIHKEKVINIFCPSCKSKRFRTNGIIVGSKRKRYLCLACSKSFSLSSKCIEVKQLFEDNYDVLHKEETYMKNKKQMLSTKYQETKYRNFFNGRLIQLDFENRQDRDVTIKQAFYDTNNYIIKEIEKMLKKQKDSFAFLLNIAWRDISYMTEHAHYLLVFRHDINNYSSQIPELPIIFCKCGSIDLKRSGISSNSRRRLKCKLCNTIFVIRVQNIVIESYFLMTFKQLFINSFPNFELIDELMVLMLYDFYYSDFTKYLNKIVSNLDIITYHIKDLIIQLFFIMQIKRLAKYIEGLLLEESLINNPMDNKLLMLNNLLSIEVCIEDFMLIKSLDFLKNDTLAVKEIISNSKQYEMKIPLLFDSEALLEKAVEDTVMFYKHHVGLKNQLKN